MQRNHIVFQSYGSEANLQECLFALISLAKITSNTDKLSGLQIHIYTDQKIWFTANQIALPISYHNLDEITLKKWRGDIDFVHRIKIELLRNLATQVEGNILYLDSDICFLKPVNDLFEKIEMGHLLMHVSEGIVSEEGNPILKKLNRFLKNNNPIKIKASTEQVSTNTMMWNAGVLGLQSSRKLLLDEVLVFTDTVFPMFPKHIVEQFAFSYYLGKTSQIHSTGAAILHYWNLKELRQYLASFFNYCAKRSWEEKMYLADMIQVQILIQEKLSFYRNRSVLDKVRGKHYEPIIPDWHVLEKQL
jgi:hypothetical protein